VQAAEAKRLLCKLLKKQCRAPRVMITDKLAPDHPDTLAWLWAHWGTTAALRHVAVEPAPALRAPLAAGTAVARLSLGVR